MTWKWKCAFWHVRPAKIHVWESAIRVCTVVLNTWISIKHGNNKTLPDTTYIGNGPVRRVIVEEFIRHNWVKNCTVWSKTAPGAMSSGTFSHFVVEIIDRECHFKAASFRDISFDKSVVFPLIRLTKDKRNSLVQKKRHIVPNTSIEVPIQPVLHAFRSESPLSFWLHLRYGIIPSANTGEPV